MIHMQESVYVSNMLLEFKFSLFFLIYALYLATFSKYTMGKSYNKENELLYLIPGKWNANVNHYKSQFSLLATRIRMHDYCD